MDNSIFSSITSYTPTPYMDPQENFLTELFAWALNHVPGFAMEYVLLLNQLLDEDPGLINEETIIGVETQVTVTNGYIDMVIYTDTGVNYICEHKIDSEVSDNQIQKYMDNQDELRNDGKYHSVLLAKWKYQEKDDPDAFLLWSDVDALIEQVIDSYIDDQANYFVLEQFSMFLKEKGLGRVKPMDVEYFRTSYIQQRDKVQKADDQLKNVFNELAGRKWDEEIPELKEFQIDDDYPNEYSPKRTGPEWGRVGISFFKHWRPGVFAGVLYDGTDHKLQLSDETKGPDLVVILDVGNDIKKKLDSFEWTINMKTRLRKDHAPFKEFVDAPKSGWRLAVLQTPLYDIIKDASTLAEQEERIAETIKAGIKLYLGNE